MIFLSANIPSKAKAFEGFAMQKFGVYERRRKKVLRQGQNSGAFALIALIALFAQFLRFLLVLGHKMQIRRVRAR